MQVQKRNGKTEMFNFEKIAKVIRFACNEEQTKEFLEDLQLQIHSNMTTKDIQNSLIRLAVDKVSLQTPEWDKVAEKLYLYGLIKETNLNRGQKKYGYFGFYQFIKQATNDGLYDPRILKNYCKSEIEELGEYIKPERDYDLSFVGLRTLSEKYLIRGFNGEALERPQEAFMGVAMLIALDEEKESRVYWSKQFYDVMSKLEMTEATPTMMNARRPNSQYSSCFIGTMDDSLESIYNTVSNFASVSKNAGGMGVYMGKIRAINSDIRGFKGKSGGVIPWGKLINDTCVAVDQLGSRKGAVSVTLDVWHKDIVDFLGSRLNTGDERRKLHDIFPAVSIPDIFMRKLKNKEEWNLFCPHEIETLMGYRLEDCYDNGKENLFSKRYEECVAHPLLSRITVSTIDILKMIIKSAKETGTPFLFFRDNVNRMNPASHLGMIYSSNLCVTGDTKLLTKDGYFTAKELYESGQDLEVVIDNRTKNNNLEHKGSSIVNALPMHLTAKQTKVYKLKTNEGFELKATAWHKMYAIRNESIVKIPLNELKEGDKILLQSGEGSYGKINEPDLAYISGIVAGDGCITDKDVKIYLYGEKVEHKEKIEECVKTLIQKYFTREAKHNANFEPKFVYNMKKDRYVLSSQLLYDVFKQFGIIKETKTKIPEFIWGANKDTQSAYLSGLYQMDGTVNVSEKYKAGSVELTQINEEYLREIQMLLLNMGVYSTLYIKHGSRTTVMPDGRGGKREFVCKPAHKLSVQDRNAREVFMSYVNLKNKDKDKMNKFTLTLNKKSRSPKHKFTATVNSIEFYGVEDVYDTTQPEYHSLIFNGIATGNCHEITQNMSPNGELVEKVIEGKDGDKYVIHSREIGDFVTCNLASINLAHTNTKEKLSKVIPIAVRMIDNVISMNNLPVKEAQETNKKYRAIGLGVFGLHDLLALNHIKWESEESLQFQDDFFEEINYLAIKSSMELAKEKGKCPASEGSEWETGAYFDKRNYISERWNKLKSQVEENGMRNTYIMAVAPTGASSLYGNGSASIDPIYKLFYIEEKKNAINPVVVRYPEKMWFYKESHQIDQTWSIRANSIRQRHIDQSQSFNLYITPETSAGEVAKMYMMAWELGTKTIYYTRSLSKEVEECESCSV